MGSPTLMNGVAVPFDGSTYRRAGVGDRLEEACPWRQPGDPLDGRQRRHCSGPAGNLKPAKDKSTERIDGIVALIMAIGRALVAQEEPQPEYSMFFV